MSKWWFLLAILAVWLTLGYVLLPPRGANAQDQALSQANPTRLVSLAPNLTELLFALGLGEQIVGVTRDSDYPPAAAGIAKVGTFWQPNIEAVIAARPDLVLTLAFEQQRNLAARLERAGCRCRVLDIQTVADLFAAIDTLGQTCGAGPAARMLLADIHTRIGHLKTTTARSKKVRVLWVVQREPLRVAGRDTFVNEMIELAGGENAIGPTLHKYPPVGAEQIITSGAEVIIEPAMVAGDLNRQRDQARAYWQRFAGVPAVANGRIHVIDGDIVSRLGPRVYEGIEAIAKCLRPDLFGE